jgi:hypothetical protein
MCDGAGILDGLKGYETGSNTKCEICEGTGKSYDEITKPMKVSKSAYVIDELSSFTYTKLGPITFSELLEDPQIVPDVVGLSQFNATLNKINAQNGKKISSDLAEELRGEIHTIQNKLGASLV